MFDELIVYVLRKNDDLPKQAFKAIEFGVDGEVFEERSRMESSYSMY